MPDKLNKLQIRAKILNIIKSYTSEDDFTSAMHIENVRTLNGIEDKKFMSEIFLKELISASGIELDAVKCLIGEVIKLEDAEDLIWKYLQEPDISDKQKNIFLRLLSFLGGKFDIDDVAEYVDDYNSFIDNETKSLLEVAAVNPEAQIDFLDFLMSFKAPEQLQLIKTLHGDFKGDELANLIAPCLRINIDSSIKEEVISILASSKSYLAVKPLKNYIAANSDTEIKKSAIKALNQLKTDGVDIDNKDAINLRENEICKSSTFYKAFLSQVDGCGNQGLIFSRITPNGKITMFSTVINTSDGIMDCFGLHNISENDFLKVISRFKANDMVVPITAEVAKYKLSEAENLNNASGNNIPYEYLCWNVYTCDIEALEIDYASLKTEEIKIDRFALSNIYETEVFDSWYFEYDDNIVIQQLLDFVIENASNSDDLYIAIENKIKLIFDNLFTPNIISEYFNMLNDASFIFYLNNDFKNSNICANLAYAIKNGYKEFLYDIIRRSILQYLATMISEDDESQNTIFSKSDSIKLSKETAYKLLQELEQKWDNADE